MIKIFQIEKYQQIIFNPIIILIISLITICTSIWLYTQIGLIISGDTEQVKDNISTLLSPSSKPNSSDNKQNNQIQKFSAEDSDQTKIELLPKGFSISKYADCLQIYQDAKSNANNTEAIFYCKKTEKYCLSIRYLKKIDLGKNQNQKLSTGQTICNTKGWYSLFNKYSKDFNF
ncbi:hypothetical protein [Anabaena cylindrica]|uniref:hypothetical protein n=1 Tax=Anabaena cylindrica TaxID=1165 RepID=UPI002B20148F|nr:hypothetical protein [Anabaena cylindrica]